MGYYYCCTIFKIVTCILLIGYCGCKGNLGEECDGNFSCHQANTTCSFGLCRCQANFHHDVERNICTKGALLGDSCDSEHFCWHVSSICLDDRCTCPQGFEPEINECVPQDKLLGDECFSHAQCTAPFAQCLDGRCACASGFVAADQHCKPTSAYCMTEAAPLQEDGLPIVCSLQLDGTQNCSEGMDCVPVDEPVILRDFMTIAGICCPKSAFNKENVHVESRCPFGDQQSLASCYEGNWETHFVFSGTFYKDKIENLCCPRACTNDRIYHDGQCYASRLPWNAQCQFSFQCLLGQECAGSRCACGPGYELINEKCYWRHCPTGQPLVGENDEQVRCANESCPEGFFCVKEFDFCCPSTVSAESVFLL